MTQHMTVQLDDKEMKLLEECCVFEPWLDDNIRRARRTKKSGVFILTLEGEEQRDILSALEASAYYAKQDKEDEKSLDFAILHDKIIIFTPDDFEMYSLDVPAPNKGFSKSKVRS